MEQSYNVANPGREGGHLLHNGGRELVNVRARAPVSLQVVLLAANFLEDPIQYRALTQRVVQPHPNHVGRQRVTDGGQVDREVRAPAAAGTHAVHPTAADRGDKRVAPPSLLRPLLRHGGEAPQDTEGCSLRGGEGEDAAGQARKDGLGDPLDDDLGGGSLACVCIYSLPNDGIPLPHC